jgi:hypothetical protein
VAVLPSGQFYKKKLTLRRGVVIRVVKS